MLLVKSVPVGMESFTHAMTVSAFGAGVTDAGL